MYNTIEQQFPNSICITEERRGDGRPAGGYMKILSIMAEIIKMASKVEKMLEMTVLFLSVYNMVVI